MTKQPKASFQAIADQMWEPIQVPSAAPAPADAPEPVGEKQSESAQAPERASRAKAAAKGTAKPKTAKPRTVRRALPSALRVGVYLTAAEFASIKSAYLADWMNGGQANTFSDWACDVLERESARGAAARAADRTPRVDTGGGCRTFHLTPQARAAMRDAITEDRRAGVWLSDSAWCAEAMLRAVVEATKRNGGTLPPAPARLPSKLTR